MLSLSNCFLVE